jgi:hypothetical protein
MDRTSTLGKAGLVHVGFQRCSHASIPSCELQFHASKVSSLIPDGLRKTPELYYSALDYHRESLLLGFSNDKTFG